MVRAKIKDEIPADAPQTEEEKQRLKKEYLKRKEEKKLKLILECIEHKKERDKMVDLYKKDGKYVYELYSILIHRGGAFRGHYFAFIKSFDDGKWYEFNDTIV